MIDLIERIEKLTGPDREVDVEVWLATTDGAFRNKWSYTHTATGRVCEVDETRDKFGHLILVPEFTTSLDAAMTLVPANAEVHVYKLQDSSGASAQVGFSLPSSATRAVDWRDHNFLATGSIMATALCAAALRARSSQGTDR